MRARLHTRTRNTHMVMNASAGTHTRAQTHWSQFLDVCFYVLKYHRRRWIRIFCWYSRITLETNILVQSGPVYNYYNWMIMVWSMLGSYKTINKMQTYNVGNSIGHSKSINCIIHPLLRHSSYSRLIYQFVECADSYALTNVGRNCVLRQ